MFSCLQILEAFLWFVLITLLNVTLIILTLSVSRLLNLLLRLVAFLLFLNPQCLASISRWRSEERRVGKECRSRWAADYLKKKKGIEMLNAISVKESLVTVCQNHDDLTEVRP